MNHNQDILLDIQNLSLSFHSIHGKTQVIRDLSIQVKKNEVFALIGESGCGKSATAKTINQILPKHITSIDSGKIIFEGENLLEYSEKEMQKIRGNKISMIFQEPMTSLNPVFTIGQQICDVFMTHSHMTKKEAKQKAIALLKKVHIPSPENRINSYPHQLSGGMQQRAMIAMAFASPNPSLLIADEPTTALDVTIQAQVMSLLQDLKETIGLTVLFITHDMGLVAQYADRLAVMYCGRKVEEGTVSQIFEKPTHPYTLGLLKSIPTMDNQSNDKNIPHRLTSIEGQVPNLKTIGKGCPFYSRCTLAKDICKLNFPKSTEVIHEGRGNHKVFCHFASEYKE